MAHVNPPGIIFQLRNFDVVLLVMIWGALGANSYKKCNNYWQYLRKRFIRLIIPVWIFLTIFFIIIRIFNYKQITYSLEKILESYLMFDGIGYVWIFRVYLLGALVMPLLLKMKENLSKKIYYIVLMLSYLGYEVLYYLTCVLGYKEIFLENIVFYMIPYGVCLGIGMTMKNIKDKKFVMFSVILIVIFVIMAGLLFVVNGELVTTNECKYPPRIYFFKL